MDAIAATDGGGEGMKDVRYASSVTCSTCCGSGVIITKSYSEYDSSGELRKKTLKCPVCDGRGYLPVETGNSSEVKQ